MLHSTTHDSLHPIEGMAIDCCVIKAQHEGAPTELLVKILCETIRYFWNEAYLEVGFEGAVSLRPHSTATWHRQGAQPQPQLHAKVGDGEPTTMKRKTERVKPLSEREVQAFLNDDGELSEQGCIQWQRAGIWRWISSDGLAYAASDGRTVEISRTANGETLSVPVRR